jgi:hypothetical protein
MIPQGSLIHQWASTLVGCCVTWVPSVEKSFLRRLQVLVTSKKFYSLILVLLGTTLLLSACGTEVIKFQSFSSTEGAFSVLMPGTPKTTKQSNTVSDTTVDLYLFSASTPDSNGVYTVIYMDYPADQVKLMSSQFLLESYRDGVVQGLKGKILSEKDVTLGQLSGKELEISSENNGSAMYNRGQIYLSKNRIYQVFVVYQDGKQSAKDIQTFLDSFKING